MFLITFALIFGAILFALRICAKTMSRPCKSYKCLNGNCAIITGANTGIGYYTALDFAKRGAKVILACRNCEKANEAKELIIAITGNKDIHVKIVDFKSVASVRAFCEDVNNTVDGIDILVNNAGAGGLLDVKTADNFDVTWQTNYLSPFLLTLLLLDKIKRSKHGRIVNVSSIMAKPANISVNHINKYHMHKVYSWTKQANILFTRELARRLGNSSSVTTYALHPGVIYTDIWRHLPSWVLIWWLPLMQLCFKNAEEGAQTTIYCATADECASETGLLYAECSRIEMYSCCKDMKLAKDLWEESVNLLKLQPHEII